MFPAIIVALHTVLAWILVEVFVNKAHALNRNAYVALHYVSVVAAFVVLFGLYFSFFQFFTVFTVTMIAMGTLLILELVVFRYLYSGERWFLNFTDWIFPMFLAISSIYLMGTVL